MSGPTYRESLLSTVPLDEKEIGMSKVEAAGTFALGPHCVKRLGYGAMQLAGPGVYGPPRDRAMAIAILREAVESGVNHIDTSDYYGPHITNQIIRDALHPYRHELVIVTKVGARHGTDASWKPAMTRDELTQAVHDNLRYLGLDVLGVLNLRRMFARSRYGGRIPQRTADSPRRASAPRAHSPHRAQQCHPAQVAEAREICGIVCVQNLYNLAHRGDDALIDALAANGIAYVSYFPLGGLTPL
jgi:pyridoxine 4-dehydrogenase